MQVVELSNHPGEMLRDVSLRQRAADRKAQDRYEDASIRHEAAVQTIRVRRDRVRQNRQWLTWLRLAFAVAAEKRRAPRRPPPSEPDSDAAEKIRAGIAGEQLVAAELGQALGDDWTLLRGYRNRRGEIDHLLLGPNGLFAIEVKNINATVHIDGDRWRADKYDNYGNLVEQRTVTDRGGRSPSQQLNEPSDELERFLHERGQQVTVQRVVLLTHPRSRLGPTQSQTKNPTVNVGISTAYLLTLVHAEPAERQAADRQAAERQLTERQLTERQRAEIARLIRRDHDFHERTRRPRTRHR
jgi:Nuclease-related domain